MAHITWSDQDNDNPLDGYIIAVTSPDGNTEEDNTAHRVRNNETKSVEIRSKVELH